MENETERLNIGIIGLGLIGGSIGRAVLKKTAHVVYGKDVSPLSAQAAKLVRAVTEELTEEVLPLLDILILAVNPRTAIQLLGQYLPFLKNGCIVTDVGGNKRGVTKAFAAAAGQYPGLSFIGCHPMAGKEFSGLKHSVASLFEGASVLMVPVQAGLMETAKLKAFFTELGFADCRITNAEEHDKKIAFSSQLCHAVSLSYCLNPLADECAGFTAGSFRDLTRVARLNSAMWAELFCDNADNLSLVMDEFIRQMTELKTAVENRDEETVRGILAAASAKKERLDRG